MPRGFGATRVTYADSLDAPEIARNRRIGLVMAGVVAVAGLGVVTLLYTAPFADPPAAAMIEASEAAPITASAGEDAAPTPETSQQTVQVAGLDKPDGVESDARAVDEAAAATMDAEDVLEEGDERWASIYPKPIRVTTTRVPGARAVATSYADDPSKRVTNAFGSLDTEKNTDAESRDEVETAAIPPAQLILPTPRPDHKPPVDDKTSSTDSAPDEKPAAKLPTPARNVTVNSAVNMRASPHSGSHVMMVIPDNATVGLVDCNGWCQVVYNDRSGYIYKSFIGNGGSNRTASSTASRKSTDDPVQRTLRPLGR